MLLANTALEILERFPSPATIAVDMPIGLTDAGKRAADVHARRVLGAPRASSVFPAPIRPILNASTREEASSLHRQADGRGFGTQSWAILPRIREWDDVLRANRARIPEVFEVHPEVSFWALNENVSIGESKKHPKGASNRLSLVSKVFGRMCVSRAIKTAVSSGARTDDAVDAIVALWSAGRISRGHASSLPVDPPKDREKLPMAIWY